MNRNLLIVLDKTVFKVLFYLLVLAARIRGEPKSSLNPLPDSPGHFLVIRPGGAGDGLMSIPLLRALKRNFPQTRVTVLCVKKSKAGLQLSKLWDELHAIDDLTNLAGSLRIIFRNHYDVVFDLEQFRRVTSVITYLTRAGIRIGFDTGNRRLLYTHFVTYANDKHYEPVNMVNQLKVLGIHVPHEDSIDTTFALPEELEHDARNRLDVNNVDSRHHNVVAIFPGVLKAHHRWKMEEFASLTDMIIDHDRSTRVLLMGASMDAPDSREVIRRSANKKEIIDFTGKLNFSEALAILAHCSLAISCDGGAVYMAAAVGCGTISLWGPGVMERFKPEGEIHVGIRKDYFCVPCVNYSRLGEFPGCPYHRRCLNDITAEEVFGRYIYLRNLLSARRTRHLLAT